MTGSIPRKIAQAFTYEFMSKKVLLYKNGKKRFDILREYNLCTLLPDK